MHAAPCSISKSPVASYRVVLPYRPIQKPLTQAASIGQNGKQTCSILLASLCIWHSVAGFGASLANGRLDLGGYDYYLGTTRRNQMLELHFDADQGCFLGQPADSDTIITFAPKGLTKTELMGELGHLLALPVYQLALPFTHEAWRQLAYTRALTGTTL